MLLLPPKEGVVDNFHISSKFGDFRQCWEAWLQLPEAHVEVIKLEKGGWGESGRQGEEEEEGGRGRVLRVASCQPGNMSKVPGSKLCVRISSLSPGPCVPGLEWEC